MNDGGNRLGISNPFFKRIRLSSGATLTSINGKEYINYASYNYLGMSGHPAVAAAAKQAIDQYGTPVSASRPVSGERPIHRQLEKAIAEVYQVDDAVAFVSGHATNVSTIGYLFGPKDLVLHDGADSQQHSAGYSFPGAKRLSFPHNDYATLFEQILKPSDTRLNGY